MGSALFVLALLVVSIKGQFPELYATTTVFRGSTDIVVQSVQVESDGTLTPLFDDLIYFGGAATINGISALDQKNKVFYFVTDYLTSFVYAADVENKKLLAPLITNLQQVNNLNWDSTRNALFIDGTENQNNKTYYQVYQYNTDDGTLFNVASVYNVNLYHSTIDTKNALLYFTDEVKLYSLSLLNPTSPTGVNISCSDATGAYIISYLYYDNVHQQLIGLGLSPSPALHYGFFHISATGACKVTSLELPNGIALSQAYDPVSQILYLGYIGPTSLVTYNTVSGNLTSLAVNSFLNDIEVVFKD